MHPGGLVPEAAAIPLDLGQGVLGATGMASLFGKVGTCDLPGVGLSWREMTRLGRSALTSPCPPGRLALWLGLFKLDASRDGVLTQRDRLLGAK